MWVYLYALFVLSLPHFSYGQEIQNEKLEILKSQKEISKNSPAQEGTYQIIVPSVKFVGKDLDEETLREISRKRQADEDIILSIGENTINVMSNKNINAGIRWAKYLIISN